MLETGHAGKWVVFSTSSTHCQALCTRRWLKSEYTEPQKYQANLVSSLCMAVASSKVTARADDDCCVYCRSCCEQWDSLLGLCW